MGKEHYSLIRKLIYRYVRVARILDWERRGPLSYAPGSPARILLKPDAQHIIMIRPLISGIARCPNN